MDHLQRVLDLMPRDVLKFAHAAAATQDPVLLLGETGTGKTLLARVIHALSPRRKQVFRSINIAGMPATLFERELFGHVKGAFTDAKRSAPGIFEAAHHGTLLLDEIGELPEHLQPKLLSIVEDKQIRRIGSTSDVAIDVRIISGTNADLEALVTGKRFRADLFFRLAVLTCHLPPLRERLDQLRDLIEYLLERATNIPGQIDISEAAAAALCAYAWPGNIRELDGVLRATTALSHSKTIHDHHLPAYIRRRRSMPHGPVGRYASPSDPSVEKKLIAEALMAEHGNRSRTARRLGMSRATLYTKLYRHVLIPASGAKSG